MKSTLNDLKKYLAMYLNEGKTPEGIRILGSTGIREMCRPRQDYGAFGYYGYGLSMKRLDDLKVVEHGGSLPGVSSNIAWSNEAEAAVIVLCNTSGVPVRLISDALMRMYNGRNPVDRRDVWQETSWDEETILEAQGMYISGERDKGGALQEEGREFGGKREWKRDPHYPGRSQNRHRPESIFGPFYPPDPEREPGHLRHCLWQQADPQKPAGETGRRRITEWESNTRSSAVLEI